MKILGSPRSRPLLVPALALWGWQTELLPWALLMGVLLELPRWVRPRLDIPVADFNRLWNFSTLLFLGVGLYLFLAREGLSSVGNMVSSETPGGRLDGLRVISQTALVFLRWLPFVLFPFVLAFGWSRLEALPWTTFSLYARAKAARNEESEWSNLQLQPHYPYLVLVLFASLAATSNPQGYLAAFVGVVAVALWPWRNPRFAWWQQVGLLTLILGLAYPTQRGLSQLREAWQNLEGRLLQTAGSGNIDQFRTVTALGAVGQIKQSGGIVLRIRPADTQAPGLLREAAFNRFRGRAWSSSHRDFAAVGTATEGDVWRVVAGRRVSQVFTVSRYTSGGQAPLALPGSLLTVRDLPLSLIETNYLASARLQDGPTLVQYQVEAGEGGGFDGPVEAEDTQLETLAPADLEVINEVAGQLGLTGLKPEAAIETVERFFASGFEYSLWQRRLPTTTNGSPLSVFLRQTRSGHCEYYATATVLLLRAAGVPTRYVVGFSPEARGEEWIARGRDAHAWCLAWVAGRWRDVDTTPGSWRERERAQAGWWEGISDLFSEVWFRFSVWRQTGGNWQLVVFAVAALVLSWLAWRQLRGSRWRRSRPPTHERPAGPPPPGLDSEVFELIRHWERRLDPRQPPETLVAWIRRLGLLERMDGAALTEAVRLHQRLRFDPRGLPPDERERLRELVRRLRLTS